MGNVQGLCLFEAHQVGLAFNNIAANATNVTDSLPDLNLPMDEGEVFPSHAAMRASRGP